MQAGTDSHLNAAWARVRGRLRSELGDAAYRSWLKPLTLAGLTDGELRLSAPTRFMRDWILSHY
ncbi:MAG: DnaA N-terminal domain-containing protein, partial [Dongiaceae bacterium]